MRLAVVGDCHGQYNNDDNLALTALAPDAALFVGDYGNEDVLTVKSIARLHGTLPIATIFGNHDAWDLSRKIGNKARKEAKKRRRNGGSAASTEEADSEQTVAPGAQPRLGFMKEYNAVREQHALLLDSNVGWGRLDFGEYGLPLSVVGSRPFSSGGSSLDSNAEFYRELWGVRGVDHSAHLIAEAIESAPPADECALVVLAHNGPRGLGGGRASICGKDWGRSSEEADEAYDWGDEDLGRALQMLRSADGSSGSAATPARSPPLVVFGHMHEALQGGGRREMIAWQSDQQTDQQTLYVNAAVVPRWREAAAGGIERAFTLVELEEVATSVGGWLPTRVELVWALPSGEVGESHLLWGDERKGSQTSAAPVEDESAL